MFTIDPRFRLASVESFDVNSAITSSILQFGDVFSITAESNALAVQQQTANFTEFEKDPFEMMPYYKKKPTHAPVYPVILKRVNLNPTIQVRRVTFNGISTSGVSVVGSVHSATMMSRVRQIRQFDQYPQTAPPLHRKEN
ncbi:spore germination protein GerPE [Gottfriedia solisilvae]|uniref:Spore germination protein GerPE n=1 Tax=Gottfriedia solisilvae TaxID=1516104 RepID=A0A8J3AJN0_9BACI|nr:spore germination protein GerPE [Gottfriedia solisilvae]GGI15040.1 hypothetical protein GCM10007380_25970 [Gottfriedia solisilvae]